GSAHLPIAAEAGFVEVLALTATVGPAAHRPPVGRAPAAGAPRRDTATERPRYAGVAHFLLWTVAMVFMGCCGGACLPTWTAIGSKYGRKQRASWSNWPRGRSRSSAKSWPASPRRNPRAGSKESWAGCEPNGSNLPPTSGVRYVLSKCWSRSATKRRGRSWRAWRGVPPQRSLPSKRRRLLSGWPNSRSLDESLILKHINFDRSTRGGRRSPDTVENLGEGPVNRRVGRRVVTGRTRGAANVASGTLPLRTPSGRARRRQSRGSGRTSPVRRPLPRSA